MVRARHPGGVATRLTHTLSPVDYTQPSDKYYGSQIDLEAVTVVDLGAGSVTDGAIVPGGLDGGTLIRAGTLPPAALDLTPPPPPVFISGNLSSRVEEQADGGSSVVIDVAWAPPAGGWPADFFGVYVYVTADSDNDPVTPSPIWTRPIVVLAGKDVSSAVVTGVAGSTQYWVYLRSVDVVGNYSMPTATYSIITAKDASAPDIPQGVVGAGGYRLVGLRWQVNTAPDLMFNEVRIAPSVNPDGTGGPAVAAWSYDRLRSSVFIEPGLNPGFYYGQVRSIDYSGNVAARWAFTGNNATDLITCPFHTFANGQEVSFEEYTGAPILAVLQRGYVVNATATTFQISLTVGGAVLPLTSDSVGFVRPLPAGAVDYLAEAEAGWAAVVGPMQATLIGASDMAVNSLMTNMLSSGVIDAGTIQTGILRVNTAAGPNADGIQIVYGSDSRVVGQWDENGLVVRSKTADRRLLDYISLDDAQLIVWKDGGQQAAINKDGINATAITFGISPGGHNLVGNSSFELSKFVVTSLLQVGVNGYTFLGGVGGWALVSSGNATLAAATITMAAL